MKFSHQKSHYLHCWCWEVEQDDVNTGRVNNITESERDAEVGGSKLQIFLSLRICQNCFSSNDPNQSCFNSFKSVMISWDCRDKVFSNLILMEIFFRKITMRLAQKWNKISAALDVKKIKSYEIPRVNILPLEWSW